MLHLVGVWCTHLHSPFLAFQLPKLLTLLYMFSLLYIQFLYYLWIIKVFGAQSGYEMYINVNHCNLEKQVLQQNYLLLTTRTWRMCFPFPLHIIYLIPLASCRYPYSLQHLPFHEQKVFFFEADVNAAQCIIQQALLQLSHPTGHIRHRILESIAKMSRTAECLL